MSNEATPAAPLATYYAVFGSCVMPVQAASVQHAREWLKAANFGEPDEVRTHREQTERPRFA